MTARSLSWLLFGLLTAFGAAPQEPPAEAPPAEAAPPAETAPAEAAPEQAPAEVAAPEAPPAEVPPPPEGPPDILQVQMHVWISETNEQGLRDLGANLQFVRFVDGVEQPTGSLQEVRTNVFDPLNPSFSVTLPAPAPSLFDPPLRPDLAGTPADGIQSQGGAGLTFSLIDDDRGTIEGVFRSIEQKQDLDLISKPELLVINGSTAEINAGGEVPFQDLEFDNKGAPQLNVAFKEIGVNMKVTPTIRSDNFVQLQLDQLDVSDVARIDNIRGVDLPVISKRSQTGVVLVPSGTVAAIGGLSSRIIRKSERRVPILGRIPLLGIPFRGRQSEVDNTHLLVWVAPTIVDLREMSDDAMSALQFWREGSWRFIREIEEEIEVLDQE